MADQQLWALIAFVVLVMVLAVALPTSRPRLDGRQKYRARRAPLLDDNAQRTSMPPLAAALAVIFGGSSSGTEESSHSDAGSYDTGGDYGGDSGGDGGGGGE